MKSLDLTKVTPSDSTEVFDYLATLDSLVIGSKLDSEKQIEYLKSLGVKAAIDMKQSGETNFNDKEALNKAGINYYHFPVGDLNAIDFKRLNELKDILERENDTTFIYCMSGNRVGAVLALYLAEICGHPKQRAFAVGEKIGMRQETSKKIVLEKLSSY